MATATRPESIPEGYEWDAESERLVTGIAAELNASGDSRIQWDKNVPVEVDLAREAFDRLRAKGYTAFKTNRAGERGERIDRFDPDAERILLVPQYQGG